VTEHAKGRTVATGTAPLLPNIGMSPSFANGALATRTTINCPLTRPLEVGRTVLAWELVQ
jgi:hypothetical protein